jgi:ABC-2 type transport system permease protein
MTDVLLILLPGAMYFWVLFVGQAPMLEILREKETQVLGRILSCPVTPTQYIGAKMLRCFVLCSLATGVLLVSSALLFGIRWGNPLKLVVVVVTWASSMTGLLAFIFALSRTREQANVFSALVLVLFGMLGGSMFPFENLPRALQLFGRFTPTHWAVVLLQGVTRSKAVGDLTMAFTALLVLAVLGIAIALLLFKRRLTGVHTK